MSEAVEHYSQVTFAGLLADNGLPSSRPRGDRSGMTATAAATKRAAIYVRVSTGGREEERTCLASKEAAYRRGGRALGSSPAF